MVDYVPRLPDGWIAQINDEYRRIQRDLEMAEMELFFNCHWKLLALILAVSLLFSMVYPPCFGLRVNMRTMWGFILSGLVVYAAILIEYEIRLRRDYEATGKEWFRSGGVWW